MDTMMMILDNKTALVTGAAQGVGQGISLELAKYPFSGTGVR